MYLEAVEEMGRQLTEVQKGCREECVQEFLGVSKVGSFVRDNMACRNILGQGEDWHLQCDSRFRPQELGKRPQSMNYAFVGWN
jgi:hypothetical protein